MATAYPGGLDNFNNPTAVSNLSDAPVIHHAQHANANDAIKAIETELGINPKGASASVKDRLAAIEAALGGTVASSTVGQPGGLATLDGAQKLAQNVDAGKINSGTVAVARIPNLSGAKILGTGGGGAAIPVDAVPNLDAGKTTTGTFATARIPNLDAAKITTGTVDAARLPAAATANANARTFADAAARDAAIPIGQRVEGMMAWLRTTPPKMTLWNATTSAWEDVPEQQERWQWISAAGGFNSPLSGAYGTVWSWAVVAGRSYAFDGVIFAGNPSSSSPGVKVGWTWSGTGTMTAGRQGVHSGVNSPAFVGDLNAISVVNDTATPLQDPSGMSVPAGFQLMVHVAGTFICTANGAVNFQIAQNASDATYPVVLGVGSRMCCRRMVS